MHAEGDELSPQLDKESEEREQHADENISHLGAYLKSVVNKGLILHTSPAFQDELINQDDGDETSSINSVNETASARMSEEKRKAKVAALYAVLNEELAGEKSLKNFFQSARDNLPTPPPVRLMRAAEKAGFTPPPVLFYRAVKESGFVPPPVALYHKAKASGFVPPPVRLYRAIAAKPTRQTISPDAAALNAPHR